MKNYVYSAVFMILFFSILLFPEQAFCGASKGLTLWLETLVPSLLPVMILSNLLISTNLAGRLAYPAYILILRFLGLSIFGSYALLCGFLCGFPMGVKVLSDLRKKNMISEEESAYLALFCNNVSPAFTLNYLFRQHLNRNHLPVGAVLMIVYGSPLLYGLLTNPIFRNKNAGQISSVSSVNKASFTAPNMAVTDACITNGIQSITKLGGYITLFSVFTSIMDLIPHSSELLKALLTALLEITTGIHRISALSLPMPILTILLCTATVFGGLCCAAQSQAMLNDLGISFRRYLGSKTIITVLAFFMTIFLFF